MVKAQFTQPFAKLAMSYIERGFSPIAIKSGTKRPGCRGWDGEGWARYCAGQASRERLVEWSRDPHAGIALCGGFNGLVAIDLDDARAVDAVRRVLGGRGAPAKRGLKGATAFFRDPSGLIRPRKFRAADTKGTLVEVLGHGNATIIPPTVHPETGRPYFWVRGSLETMTVDQLPEITPDDIEALERLLAPLMPVPWADDGERVAAKPVDVFLREDQRPRYAAIARMWLEKSAANLVAKNKGSRGSSLYAAARSIGWAVSGRFLTLDEVATAFMEACQANGLVKANGEKDCWKTIENGLENQDNPPKLQDSERWTQKRQEWARKARQQRPPSSHAYRASEAAQRPL